MDFCFWGGEGLGAWKRDSNKSIKKIQVNLLLDKKVKLASSRSHPSDDLIKWINDNVKNYNMIKRGSSLKFCDIAEGKADIYPRNNPTMEWDTAEGHSILKCAGWKLCALKIA